MAELTHVRGLAELQALLDTLPAKMEQNIIRGALRAGMKPIIDDAKRNVAVASGVLRDGLRISVRAKGGKVTASLKAGGKHGYLASFIEYGTRPHRIPGPLVIGGRVIAGVDHPGARARPFMRPALDGQAGAAVVAAGEYIKRRLATKNGLDTADIDIEVET